MIELLILYSLNKTELTLYGLNKFISTYFAEVCTPSNGSIHPALQRLMKANLIEVRRKISDGGKQYSYYSVKNGFLDYFNSIFSELSTSKKENFSALISCITARIMVSSLADSQAISLFKQKAQLRLEKSKTNIENKINDKYIEFDEIQVKALKSYIARIDNLLEIIKTL